MWAVNGTPLDVDTPTSPQFQGSRDQINIECYNNCDFYYRHFKRIEVAGALIYADHAYKAPNEPQSDGDGKNP